MNRDELPFRINCEGYFFNKEGEILAKKSEKGFIMFPGGGMDKGEKIEHTMLRETEEETGANIKNLKKLAVERIIWDKDWPKTEKQKRRYASFKGDEMHFFTGDVESIKATKESCEDFWRGKKFMDPNEVVEFIENEIKSAENDEKINQRKIQLRLLKELL